MSCKAIWLKNKYTFNIDVWLIDYMISEQLGQAMLKLIFVRTIRIHVRYKVGVEKVVDDKWEKMPYPWSFFMWSKTLPVKSQSLRKHAYSII